MGVQTWALNSLRNIRFLQNHRLCSRKMKIWVLSFFCILASFHVGVNSFSCAPPEFRHTTPCEIPKCCESGELTTEFCSGCPTCAAAKEEECGAGFEAYQPDCAKGLSCFTRCPICTTENPE